jgi:hypothetical protein
LAWEAKERLEIAWRGIHKATGVKGLVVESVAVTISMWLQHFPTAYPANPRDWLTLKKRTAGLLELGRMVVLTEESRRSLPDA